MLFYGLNAQSNYSHNADYPIDAQGTVFLKSEDAKVRITAELRKDVHVEIERKVKNSSNNKTFSFEFENKNGELYITEKRESSRWLGGYNGESIIEYSIEIKVPLSTHLDLSGEDDDYTLMGIEGDIKLRNEDGDISIIDCSAEQINIKLEDGDIDVNNTSGHLKIINEDGDISIGNSILSGVIIKTEDGTISMDQSAGDLDIKSEDGDVVIHSHSASKAEVNTSDGDLFVGLKVSDNGEYNFSSEDGNVTLDILEGGANIKIKHGEDSDIDIASDQFEFQTQKSHYSSINTLQRGEATINIKTDDGDIKLKAKK